MIKNWDKFNESSGFNPRDIRVEREEFLNRESELKGSNFTTNELKSIKEITEIKDSWLNISFRYGWNIESGHMLTPEVVGKSITFDSICGMFWIIINKYEDEWYLIEERGKSTRYGTPENRYMIADGFDQVEEFLKWYVKR